MPGTEAITFHTVLGGGGRPWSLLTAIGCPLGCYVRMREALKVSSPDLQKVSSPLPEVHSEVLQRISGVNLQECLVFWRPSGHHSGVLAARRDLVTMLTDLHAPKRAKGRRADHVTI